MTEFEIEILKRCGNGIDIRSSDRPSDRAKTKLKKLGYISFARAAHKRPKRWLITDAGRVALASAHCGDEK